jgi:energy-coupling factor transporter transmembrane protein EcfT
MNLLQAFTTLAMAGRSKSTVLHPLAVMMTVVVIATLVSFSWHLPMWVGGFFAACTGIVFLLYVYAYWYFSRTDPEQLKTEHYSLQRFAIEHGVYGDSSTGVVELKPTATPANVPTLSAGNADE